jgi:hypothetical protein
MLSKLALWYWWRYALLFGSPEHQSYLLSSAIVFPVPESDRHVSNSTVNLPNVSRRSVRSCPLRRDIAIQAHVDLQATRKMLLPV